MKNPNINDNLNTDKKNLNDNLNLDENSILNDKVASNTSSGSEGLREVSNSNDSILPDIDSLTNGLDELRKIASHFKEEEPVSGIGYYINEEGYFVSTTSDTDVDSMVSDNFNNSNLENLNLDSEFPVEIYSAMSRGADIVLNGDLTLFERVSYVSANVLNSPIFTQVLQKHGIIKRANLFENELTSNMPQVYDYLNIIWKKDSNSSINPLGNFGEMTIKEIIEKGTSVIKPALDMIENVNPSLLEGGLSLIGAIFAYNSICKVHAKWINKTPLPSSQEELIKKSSKFLKFELKRINNIKLFNIFAAPVIVLTLLGAKSFFPKPNLTVTIKSNPEENLSSGEINKGFLLAFFKKMPKFLGLSLVSFFAAYVLNNVLSYYSIDLHDPLLLKWLWILCIIVSSFAFLLYFLEFLLTIYLFKNKNFVIPVYFPSKLYNFVETLQILADYKPFYFEYFYLNFLIYGFIILALIVLLIFS